MCGIGGIIPTPLGRKQPDLISGFLQRLKHRGPDDLGYLLLSRGGVELGREWSGREFTGDVALVHRRLSIIDLTDSGWQPMGTEDGRYYIVFNGEIYNYLELRGELESLGCRFRSQSDTEVLLCAYAHWGPRALVRLIGMFALAILDTQERCLFLARDFFGIKPLYYTTGRGGFAFASEIKALLPLPWVSRSVNSLRLYDYLRYGITDHGSGTLFADIVQVPAAHYLQVPLDDPADISPTRYWEVDLSCRLELSFEEAAEQLREMFFENIRLHLRSDVPVGAALSGGIDSSSIVMAMRRLGGPDVNLHTFSYIADDSTKSEEQWVDVAGSASGACVHKVVPRADELMADLEHLICIQDEPFGGTGIYAQYRVFKLASKAGMKVMLDGQGADELLGGYSYHIAARLASLVRQGRWVAGGRFFRKAVSLPGFSGGRLAAEAGAFLLPTRLHAPFRRLVGRDMAPSWLNVAWFGSRGVRPRTLNYIKGNGDLFRQNLYNTLVETSLPFLLRYEDRNSMSFSIESRVPFLTPKLVNFVLSLPEEYIVAPNGTSKFVFRAAMREVVPDTILDRRDKLGFATPQKDWLMAVKPWVDHLLEAKPADQIPALHFPSLRREWEQIASGGRPFDPWVWRWCNLIEWARLFDVSFT